jgi:hypothetical protein
LCVINVKEENQKVKRELVAIEKDGEKAVLIKPNISSIESMEAILWI